MNLIFIMIIASLCSSIASYIDKSIVNRGINKETYFYFICLTIIPFSLISLFLEDFKFSFSIIPILLLLSAMILRFFKQKSIVGCLTYLEPYEVTAYMSISILIAYFIDVCLNIKQPSFWSFIAILLMVIGIFVFSDAKLNIKNLKRDLIIRILSDIGIGYVAFYILKYWSNSFYILLLNILLVITNSNNKRINYNISKKILFLMILQQLFGFTMIYIINYLSSNAVMYSQLVKPITLLITFILSIIFNHKKLNAKNVISVIIIIFGLILISYN